LVTAAAQNPEQNGSHCKQEQDKAQDAHEAAVQESAIVGCGRRGRCGYPINGSGLPFDACPKCGAIFLIEDVNHSAVTCCIGGISRRERLHCGDDSLSCYNWIIIPPAKGVADAVAIAIGRIGVGQRTGRYFSVAIG
jgi:hypothetical protein